jgi:hypothetical protein
MAGFKSKRTAALDKLAQVTEELGLYKEPDACCSECGKRTSEGWFLYCVKCIDQMNTATAQEPVAWGMPDKDGNIQATITPQQYAKLGHNYNVPLYTAPQPKEKKDKKGVDNA